MMPSAPTMKPEPMPRTGTLRAARRALPACWKLAEEFERVASSSEPTSPCAEVLRVPVTLMLTTAGP